MPPHRETISSVKPLPVTILVVENEAIIRMELAAQLGEMVWRVLAACDADDAIRRLDADRTIAVVLTDVTMPGSMDGARLAHHVRHRWPPIVIVATSGRPGFGVGDLPAGAKFVAKPYSPQTLRAVVAPLLKDKRAPRAA